MTDDWQLLREYAANQSEDAFETLAARYVNLVYSAALRLVRDPHQAEEITQAVFILLARKARSLNSHTILSGWLYRTTYFVAADALRSQRRRQQREQEAHMQSLMEHTAPDSSWELLSPYLDEALMRLGETDRQAVVLHYFEKKTFADIGNRLGMSDDTARKRTSRALEKLRLHLARRGFASTTAILALAMSANSVQAAPAALAKSVAVIAVAKGATASGSTLTLIKGALKLMAWTKAKTAIVTGAAILLAAGTATVVVEKIATLKAPKFSATDLSWADNPASWVVDSRVLNKLPAGVLIFRPTQFSNSGGSVQADDRMLARDTSVGDLVGAAYRFPYTRTEFPSDMPRERYDFMTTIAGGRGPALQNELKARFHLTGRREKRNVEVLLLKVRNSHPPNLTVHNPDGRFSMWTGNVHEIKITNCKLDGFFDNAELIIGEIVINQTGLHGSYDLHLTWKQKPGETDKAAFKRALLEQLGLELVPARESVELLIVERLKD